MEEGSLSVLVDAKTEYTKQLITVFKQCLYQGIKSVYMDAKEICNQDNRPTDVLMVFQDLLARIPKWSQDIINTEYQRTVNVSKCDYIEDLLKVIYISHIKVLTIVHSAKTNKKITVKVPSGSHFMHLCYIECARDFWKNPYYFSENINKYELQKNIRESECIITECITETIRKQLPVRNILKEYLNDPDTDIDEENEDIKEPMNIKYMKKLETVIKKELKNINTDSNDNNEINIDLIRKVIRNELKLNPDISNTNIIKQKLVNSVIEKITAQSLISDDIIVEELTSDNKDNTKQSRLDTIPANSNADSNAPEATTANINADAKPDATPANINADAKPDATPANSNADAKPVATPAHINADAKPDATPANSNADATPANSNADAKPDATPEATLDATPANSNADNNNKIIYTNKTKDKTDNKQTTVIKSVNIEESHSPSIDNLINDSDTNTNKSSRKIEINNIDEINLDLDELDTELHNSFNELDGELEEVNINANANAKDIQKKLNSSYSFFEDKL